MENLSFVFRFRNHEPQDLEFRVWMLKTELLATAVYGFGLRSLTDLWSTLVSVKLPPMLNRNFE